MTKKILIADDEKEIRDILQMLLCAEGYETVAAKNGRQAAALADETIDMYILDVNMPEMTGFEAAREIRRLYGAPILFLTAYSGETDKIMGFSVGADDYIVKPFSNLELIMRIRAVFRRTDQGAAAPGTKSISDGEEKQGTASRANTPSGTYGVWISDVFLDTDSQAAVKDGAVIGLTYTEYEILFLLASHRKKIYSLENIYRSIWGDDAVGDGTIMVHIKNIRKKLGDNSRMPRYIKTAWGKGYYID